MIIEGRLNNVEKKFPLLATKHNGKSLIDRFSKEDPSGNNKYLAWMTDAFFEMLIRYAGNMTGGKGFEEGGNIGSVIQQIYKENLPLLVGDEPYPKTGFVEHAEKIIEAVSQFHTLLPHIKTKDIYSYETIEDLIQAIQDAKNKKKMADQKKAIKRGAKSGGTVVYENEYGLSVVRVDTTKAACFFGQSTRWCIAARENNQFETYTNDGFVFYYVLNPKHEDQDNQKFAVLFNPGITNSGPRTYRTVHPSEPLPVAEIFDAADDSIGSQEMFRALVQTGVLGDPMAAAKDASIPRSKLPAGVFDTMLDTLSAHAERNPAKQRLSVYAKNQFEDREGNQEFDFSFKNVAKMGEDGVKREERGKTAVRTSKQILLNIPMGVFENLMKALVTATGGQKIQTAPGQKLPEFNKQFYTKLRDQYIDKATSVAEELLKEFLTREEMPKVNEEQGKLFGGDEESKNFISQVRIKDVRFWTENEKRLSIGDKATAFDDAMISLARQWEGNPVAMGDVFGKDGMTKYTLKELYQFAKQRYTLSFHFMVEMFPKDAKVLTKDKAVPSNIPVPLVPSPEQPQYYILSDREAVKRFVKEVEWIEEYFIGYGFDRNLRRALEQSDLYVSVRSRRAARRKGMRQRGFDFEGTGLKPDRIKSDAPGSRRRVTVDETISRWKKIIKK